MLAVKKVINGTEGDLKYCIDNMTIYYLRDWTFNKVINKYFPYSLSSK